MFQDLRYGLRLMIRRPGFAAIAVATLALGIGTTTAIFAVTDHVLLRPVPYTAPDRLAVIWETSPTIPLPVMYASPPNLYDWQQRSKTFRRWAISSGATSRWVGRARTHPPGRAVSRSACCRPLGAAADGPLVSARGGSRQRSSGHGHQRRAVAAALSAEPQHHRTHDSDRRGADGDHRRDAAGVRVSTCGGASRHAAGGAGRVMDPACDEPRGRPARRALSRDHRPSCAAGSTVESANREMNDAEQISESFRITGRGARTCAADRAGHVEFATRPSACWWRRSDSSCCSRLPNVANCCSPSVGRRRDLRSGPRLVRVVAGWPCK